MKFKPLLIAWPTAMLVFSFGPANAGQSINVAGTMACVSDKWDEKEPEKGHKLAEYAGRCIVIPDEVNASKYVEDCAGNYEYMPDGSWKAAGSCTTDFKGGDTVAGAWQEGSELKEYPYSYTSGTGKYKGVKGGGTYTRDDLTTTLSGGRKNGKMDLP